MPDTTKTISDSGTTCSPHLDLFAETNFICSVTMSSVRWQSFAAQQKLKIIPVTKDFSNRKAERWQNVDKCCV